MRLCGEFHVELNHSIFAAAPVRGGAFRPFAMSLDVIKSQYGMSSSPQDARMARGSSGRPWGACRHQFPIGPLSFSLTQTQTHTALLRKFHKGSIFAMFPSNGTVY